MPINTAEAGASELFREQCVLSLFLRPDRAVQISAAPLLDALLCFQICGHFYLITYNWCINEDFLCRSRPHIHRIWPVIHASKCLQIRASASGPLFESLMGGRLNGTSFIESCCLSWPFVARKLNFYPYSVVVQILHYHTKPLWDELAPHLSISLPLAAYLWFEKQLIVQPNF